ncbi:MAG: hypothetical protein AAF488_09650 [Planctomycetota bacterium]
MRWLLLGLMVTLVAGCSSTNYRDLPADVRAQMIQDHLEEGQQQMIQGGEQLQGTRGDAQADLALEHFTRAQNHFQTALDIADAARGTTRSALPRVALANSLHLIASVYEWKRDDVWEQIRPRKEKGEDTASLEAIAKVHDDAAEDYALRAQDLYEYYLNYLYASYPIQDVFMKIGRNYQILSEWRKSADSYRRYIRELKLPPGHPGRVKLEQAIRVLDQRALEAIDEGLR